MCLVNCKQKHPDVVCIKHSLPKNQLSYHGSRPICSLCFYSNAIDDFRGACAVKGNGAVAVHVKRVDHDDVFDALLFREETLTRHYFILKFDVSWGISTNMGKTEGIFLNLQCNCHIVGSIIIKLINHRTISVHGCQIRQR